jgi:hypothetical protein
VSRRRQRDEQHHDTGKASHLASAHPAMGADAGGQVKTKPTNPLGKRGPALGHAALAVGV